MAFRMHWDPLWVGVCTSWLVSRDSSLHLRHQIGIRSERMASFHTDATRVTDKKCLWAYSWGSLLLTKNTDEVSENRALRRTWRRSNKKTKKFWSGNPYLYTSHYITIKSWGMQWAERIARIEPWKMHRDLTSNSGEKRQTQDFTCKIYIGYY